MRNENSDTLSKARSNLPQPGPPVCYPSIKGIISGRFRSCNHEIILSSMKGKIWGSLMENPIPRDLPKHVNFRIKTGHGYLGKHLNRIDLADSSKCPLCFANHMREHHLNSCRGLVD